MKTIFACGIIAVLFGLLSIAGGETTMGNVRVFATEPACFEYLFTGVVSETGGQPLLAFNQRNGRTSFVRVGETLGPFRVAALESKTNRVYNPALNAYLDKPADRVTLTGPQGVRLVLEQDQRLPWPGRVAWLVRLVPSYVVLPTLFETRYSDTLLTWP